MNGRKDKGLRTVLVLDGNERSALAVTRSLGKRGLRVFVGSEIRDCLAGASRYCSRNFLYPSPAEMPEEFMSVLSGVCRDLSVAVVIPVTDVTMGLILRYGTRLEGVEVPFGGHRTYVELSNKCGLVERARELGIPVPEGIVMNRWSKDKDRLSVVRYPVVVKPCFSQIWHGGRWLKTKVMRANSAQEVKRLIDEHGYLREHPFLLQRYISGSGAGVFVLCSHGQPITFLMHRRIREKPPWGGVSVLSETVPPDGPLREIAERLFRAYGWHGAAMAEFRIADDGVPYLMEVNARLWGSLQLSIDAKLDFPFHLYKMAVHELVEGGTSYTVGIRNRWLLGDLDNLIIRTKEALRGPGAVWDAAAGMKEFFLSFLDERTRCEVNRWDDLGPFWCEVRQYLGFR